MAGTQIPSAGTLRADTKILERLWPFLWPKQDREVKVRFSIACLMLILAKLATLLIPIFFKEAVDALSPPYGSLVIVPVFMIVAYGVARLLSSAFAEIRDGVFATVAQKAVRYVGLNIFKHVHKLGLRYHLDRQTGGLSRAIERGTKGIESLLSFLTFNIVPTAVEIFMVSGVLWYLYDVYIALITLTTMIIYIAFTLLVTEWRIQFVRIMNTTDNEATTKAVDSLLNYETVKYFNNENHEATRFDHALERYQVAAVKNRLSLSLLNIGQTVIISIGLVFVMIYAGSGVQNQVFTVGDLVAINAYAIQLYTPLSMLGFAYREVKIALVNITQMFELMDVPCEINDKENAPDLTFKNGKIVFENVDFFYNPNRQILRQISFTVPAGKTVAIVGSSGAGKSTISRLLFRFYDPTQGRILIDDQDIRDVNQTSLRRLIGVVPQDTVLFNDTIDYNIDYGRPGSTHEEIIEAAEAAQIHNFIEALPEGYATHVGERGLKLSGGEKQRVAIARTLLKQPKIFLFDEATSALDTRTEKQIQASLKDISKNYTTLIIAHRLSTIVDADQILVMDQGEIIERGTHQELLALNGTYMAMWLRQQHNSDPLSELSSLAP
ncbi:ABCB family ABC transporter ATP-binding protein/permease [Candidatus Paracaedibacter symbiosus]|uniref:ABCB family ABC transporter ATP-binding protein/permease n=1 Tax=Candidatus Paracaedibacter symbiosus TaxID=244582 RepID=UPI00068CD074|nr:ABC transporter ATP-binding protein/permease [Candidatus Paracaedibacter symbiosus]